MGPDCSQQEGPTPKEGSMQPPCCLIPNNEDYANPAENLRVRGSGYKGRPRGNQFKQ